MKTILRFGPTTLIQDHLISDYHVTPITASTEIRLVGGAGPWEGRLEIKHEGAWGTVCDTNFGVNEAKVVCNMLGFKNK